MIQLSLLRLLPPGKSRKDTDFTERSDQQHCSLLSTGRGAEVALEGQPLLKLQSLL